MNWNKVLNVFILIFILLNMAIYIGENYIVGKSYTLTSERKELLESVLAEKKIMVNDFYPANEPMTMLVMEPQQEEEATIVKNILGNTQFKKYSTDLSDVYRGEEQNLTFYKGDIKGTISFSGYNEKYKPDEYEEEKIIRAAETLVKDMTLSQGTFELISYNYNSEDQAYYLSFNEIYNGYMLFSSFVIMKMHERGDIEAISERYIPVKFTGDKKEIYSIDEAIYSLISTKAFEKMSESQSIITSIDLGYDLDIEELDKSQVVNAVPYYRIKLSNEISYYINAYTNEVRIFDN